MSIPSTPPRETRSVALVGSGRLGGAFARALRAAGVDVLGPTGRGEEIPTADIVLLCVPDREIAHAARAARGRAALIGHTSGATSLDEVDFGIHPLQTFAGGDGPDAFEGIACAVAGRTGEALAASESLARAIGARSFPIDDDRRAAYHAAACIASNFLVTLEDAAERVAGTAGIAPADARAMLAPLARRTLDNWERQGAPALTGPIARGDDATVARHRAAVAALPDVAALFDALRDGTRLLAERNAS
ncbi:Rossmann-like and DUF2520 domain-containing protein [Microbacterium karelineae]|uniref:Rossmann-like and DUF2520 domain-containing protein n=1 Tax=Microbacterium karelineae TaxID=2654283 RepID=UPI0012E9CD46|nr:Rossmann-like and DUF2520 domain-containing protein [Microbacterium karelineae]